MAILQLVYCPPPAPGMIASTPAIWARVKLMPKTGARLAGVRTVVLGPVAAMRPSQVRIAACVA
ncbi:MAG: hypothetical protein ACK5TP_09555 [bacterium]